MNLDNIVKAGKIAREVKDYARSIIKVDLPLLEVTEKIEQKIIDLGGKIAFPVDMSINNIAAHYSAVVNDNIILTENDLIKVDLGVHIEGSVVDTAFSIDLGNNNQDLIKSSEIALNEAIKIVRPGIRVYEIGQVIQEAIGSFGFSPIRNLSGHGIALFKVHTNPSIPNFNNGDKTELKEDQVIAIEPFASTGSGLVVEGKPSEIYELTNRRNIRDVSSRKLLSFIEREYLTLPFTKRWLLKYKLLNVQFALRNLEKEKILHQFAVLPEKSDGLVSQTEHTIIVKDKPVVVT